MRQRFAVLSSLFALIAVAVLFARQPHRTLQRISPLGFEQPTLRNDLKVSGPSLTDVLYGPTPAIDEAIQVLDSKGFTELAIKGSSMQTTLSVPLSDSVAVRKLLQDNPIKGTTILPQHQDCGVVNHE